MISFCLLHQLDPLPTIVMMTTSYWTIADVAVVGRPGE